ncbi:MAG: hypothetical protein IJ572_02560 [Bacilli bacterium]|nr:hypothetical protein [Bacilli bacterium]
MNDYIEVTLNNKKTINILRNTTIRQIALNNLDVCSDKIIGAKINNEIVDFNREVISSTNIDFFDINDLDGYKMNQAGLKFVLEVALKENYPEGIEVNYNHSIGNGIHITIDNYEFKENDVINLKKYMDEIIANDEEIKRLHVESKEAVNYYRKFNIREKANNIHNISNRIIVLYKLRKYFNYFYNGMPFSTGCLNDFELVYIKDNELALVLPTNHTFNLVEYKKYNKIIDCFKHDMNLLHEYKLPYICDINDYVSRGYSKEVIRLCETHFDNDIHDVAIKAIEKKAKYVLIAGPSSSGKTTTAKKIALNIKAAGYEVLLISTDDYFVDKENSPKNPDGTYDFESIKCVDIPKFNQDLKDIVAGNEVVLPTYNFKTGKREYINKPIKLGEKAIILIEGIHCLNDELTKYIDNDLKYKVYLSPFIPVKIDRHNYLSTTDLRLIRRMIRDNNNRGTSISQTIEQWKSVRNGEEKNIFPYIDKADIIINTSLPYELGVLKVFAEPLLYSIDNTSKYLEEAIRLIKYFENIYPIPSEYVEEDSILREFIGGSVFKKEGDK